MGVGGQRHVPAVLPPGKIRYPLYRRLGGPQGRSGRVWKISPLPGFDPQTVQPVQSRYTDCAIPATLVLLSNLILVYVGYVMHIILTQYLHSRPLWLCIQKVPRSNLGSEFWRFFGISYVLRREMQTGIWWGKITERGHLHRNQDDDIMERKEIRREGVKWFHLTQDMDKGRAPVKCNETLGFMNCEQFIC